MNSPGKESKGLRVLQMYCAIREMYLLQEQLEHPQESLVDNTRRVSARLYKDSPETLALIKRWGRPNVGK